MKEISDAIKGLVGLQQLLLFFVACFALVRWVATQFFPKLQSNGLVEPYLSLWKASRLRSCYFMMAAGWGCAGIFFLIIKMKTGLGWALLPGILALVFVFFSIREGRRSERIQKKFRANLPPSYPVEPSLNRKTLSPLDVLLAARHHLNQNNPEATRNYFHRLLKSIVFLPGLPPAKGSESSVFLPTYPNASGEESFAVFLSEEAAFAWEPKAKSVVSMPLREVARLARRGTPQLVWVEPGHPETFSIKDALLDYLVQGNLPTGTELHVFDGNQELIERLTSLVQGEKEQEPLFLDRLIKSTLFFAAMEPKSKGGTAFVTMSAQSPLVGMVFPVFPSPRAVIQWGVKIRPVGWKGLVGELTGRRFMEFVLEINLVSGIFNPMGPHFEIHRDHIQALLDT